MLKNLTNYLSRNGYIVTHFNERQITVRLEVLGKVHHLSIPATWDEVIEFVGA
jgi:hypothetical protein